MKSIVFAVSIFCLMLFCMPARSEINRSKFESTMGVYNQYILEEEKARLLSFRNQPAFDLLRDLILIYINETGLDVNSNHRSSREKIGIIETELRRKFEEANNKFSQFPAAHRSFLEFFQPSLHAIETIPFGTLKNRKEYIQRLVGYFIDERGGSKQFASNVINELNGIIQERAQSWNLHPSIHPKLRNNFKPILSAGEYYYADDIERIFINLVMMNQFLRSKDFYSSDISQDKPKSIHQLTLSHADNVLMFQDDQKILYVVGIDKQSMVFTIEKIEENLSAVILNYLNSTNKQNNHEFKNTLQSNQNSIDNYHMTLLREYSRAFRLVYQDEPYGYLIETNPEKFAHQIMHPDTFFKRLNDIEKEYQSMLSEIR